MNPYTLKSLGWSSFFEEQIPNQYKNKEYHIGRVFNSQKGGYKLLSEQGEFFAILRGKFRQNEEYIPAVGDWVIFKSIENDKKAVIHYRLPRRTKFSRKIKDVKTEEQVISANIDILFIVQSLDENFNLRRIERFLATCWESKAQPIILLNKADLCQNPETYLEEVKLNCPSVSAHLTYTVKEGGLVDVLKYLDEGKTFSFVGSSGVGKSSIINSILGEEIQKTSETRDDGKGRHTTTAREMIFSKDKGLLIDTPGMRELQLWDVGEGVENTFSDIEELAKLCRFNDCSHQKEPGCAVQKAIEENQLEAKRLENYLKIQKELDYLESRKNSKKALEEKRAKKEFSKKVRKVVHHQKRNKYF